MSTRQSFGRRRHSGAARCYNTSDPDAAEQFLRDTDGYGAPQVLEAVGIQQTILLALQIASVWADVAMIGDVLEDITIPAFDYKRRFAYHQLHLHGVYQSYTNGFPGEEFDRGCPLDRVRRIQLTPMIACVDDLNTLTEHLRAAAAGHTPAGKMIFRF